MIQPKENSNYKAYADILFSYFKGMKKGEGCFLMRIMRGKYKTLEDRQLLDYLYKVLFNLCVNDFLDAKDTQHPLEGWISLTEKGADYLQGGSLAVNKVNFNQYVDFAKSDTQQFDQLWEMIGEERCAPFYIKGPTYLNMIRPYLKTYISDYMSYMDERRNKELSTSRRIWYKELYLDVPSEKRSDFLNDLSYAVSLSFYYPEEVDEDYQELFNAKLESIGEQLEREVPQLPAISVAEDNKKQTPDELLAITIEICNAYKSLIENNRMYRLLYNDDGTAKDETAAQLLFYMVALGYCKQYDVDLNRECDPGIGEVDFKLSVGNSSKVIIEMKLSSNSSLYHGFEKQLPAYLRAEETKYGIFLILQMNKTPEAQLTKVQSLYETVKDNANNSLRLICIDASTKPSASKI